MVDSATSPALPVSNGGSTLGFIATTGGSADFVSPKSYAVDPLYFASYLCKITGNDPATGLPIDCTVENARNPDYSISGIPAQGYGMQVERMNMTHGTEIYDAAVWQIAVALHGLKVGGTQGLNYVQTAQAQTDYLIVGTYTNDATPAVSENRAVSVPSATQTACTGGPSGFYLPCYNGTPILGHTPPNSGPGGDIAEAYTFRMVPTSWALQDPLNMMSDNTFVDLYVTVDNTANPPNIYPGDITWADYKGITGEQAWAHFVGPLQADYLAYHLANPENTSLSNVRFRSETLNNAMNVLHAVALLQSPVGGIYYAPEGTLGNTGAATDPTNVSIENNASMLGGLLMLEQALKIQAPFSPNLTLVQEILYGRTQADPTGPYPATEGMLQFFLKHAWDATNTRFYTYGDAPTGGGWTPEPTNGVDPAIHAVDVNSWIVAVLGAGFLDKNLPPTASGNTTYEIWQNMRNWAGYFDQNGNLLGVGFDDSNGLNKGDQPVMSGEWTLGVIGMLTAMENYYTDPTILSALKADIASMRAGLENLTTDNYQSTTVFPATDKPVSSADGYKNVTYNQMVRKCGARYGFHGLDGDGPLRLQPFPFRRVVCWFRCGFCDSRTNNSVVKRVPLLYPPKLVRLRRKSPCPTLGRGFFYANSFTA
jgi:hypothetical protein